MSPRVPRAGGSGPYPDIPSWSEDPLASHARMVWTAGDYLPIARSFAAGAEEFVTRLGLRPGEAVLDVACGTGNLAIPAARGGARVWGVDIAPNVLGEARLEARTRGLAANFEVADAECLPYLDGQFDTTMTMFGVMFAYRPGRAAAEMLRVTRSGGRIAMANWTTDGFAGRMLEAHLLQAALPPGVPNPLAWGDEDTVRARFGNRIAALNCTRRSLELRFRLPPAAVTELFAACYGPTVATLRAAGPDGACRLREEMTRLFNDFNRADDGLTVIAAEYLDVQARVA